MAIRRIKREKKSTARASPATYFVYYSKVYHEEMTSIDTSISIGRFGNEYKEWRNPSFSSVKEAAKFIRRLEETYAPGRQYYGIAVIPKKAKHVYMSTEFMRDIENILSGAKKQSIRMDYQLYMLVDNMFDVALKEKFTSELFEPIEFYLFDEYDFTDFAIDEWDTVIAELKENAYQRILEKKGIGGKSWKKITRINF